MRLALRILVSLLLAFAGGMLFFYGCLFLHGKLVSRTGWHEYEWMIDAYFACSFFLAALCVGLFGLWIDRGRWAGFIGGAAVMTLQIFDMKYGWGHERSLTRLILVAAIPVAAFFGGSLGDRLASRRRKRKLQREDEAAHASMPGSPLTVLGFVLLSLLPATGCDDNDCGGTCYAPSALPVVRSAAGQPTLERIEAKVFTTINRIRREHRRAPLTMAADLIPLARRHSQYQARIGRLTHEDIRGREVDGRADAAEIRWRTIAENVARSWGMDDPGAAAVQSWMESRGHRAALLSDEVTETAVGVAYDAANDTHYFTQVFLQRKAVP